ncbi:hypothetical protein ILUMI_16704, partial [Ignelater luminosus]
MILTSVGQQLLKIKPDRFIKVKNKGVLIESFDPEITKLTNNKDLSRLGLEVRLPEKVWPRLIFYNVPSSLSEKDVKDDENKYKCANCLRADKKDSNH